MKTFKQVIKMNEGADSDTEGDGAEYKAFFAKALKKFGVSSPGELKGDDEKKFYDYIDANWKADDEKPESYMNEGMKTFKWKVKGESGSTSFSEKDIDEFLDKDNYPMYLNADNLPKWIAQAIMSSTNAKNIKGKVEGLMFKVLNNIKSGKIKEIEQNDSGRIDKSYWKDAEKSESYMIKASKKKKIVTEKSAVQSSWDMTEKSLTGMSKLLSPKGMLARTISAESGNNVIKEFTVMTKHMKAIMEQWEAVERAGNMNESFIVEAAKVMAKKGDYAFSKYRNGEVEVTHKGKVLATGDFDSGADSFFMDVPGTKGQKSFNSADDVIKFFVNMKENLRKDISQLSSKFPEGSDVKMPNGKIAKVVSVSKDSVKVAVGNKTMDHKPSDLESVDEEVKVDVDGDNKISKNKKEGNAFTGALNAAREKGDATFIVAGKKYKVEDMDGDEAEEDEADFVPHKMYKDGKVANADTKEEHERLADLGWTHVKPES